MTERSSVMRKDKILPFAIAWTDLGTLWYIEISQNEKEKYCMISLTCEIQKSQTHKK